MRLIFIFLILFVAPSVHCQISDLFQERISDYQNSDILKHAQWALFAEDIQNDQPLIDYNSDKSMAPASGLKLFTSATALEILGPDFQFKTKIYYSGVIDIYGTLNGNIYIRGGGDPTLGSDLVEGSLSLNDLMLNWINVFKEAGIKNIDGAIIADATLFDTAPVPGNWLWIDLGNYYGAGVSALSIHDNLYHLFFKPAKKAGMPAEVLRTEPQLTNVQFDNQMLTGKVGSGDNGYIFRAPNAATATLRGTIPAGVTEFSIKGSLPDPALFCADYLKQMLIKNDINVTKDSKKSEAEIPYDKISLLHSTLSPSLADIVEVLNKRSVNHIGEQLLLMLSVDSTGTGKRGIGIKQIRQFLKQNHIDTAPLHLEDGSGLSPNNLISAKMMVGLLSKMQSKKSFKIFYNSMSLAGDPLDLGFFKNFGRNTLIEKKCRIKSGLIQGVRSHSGYLTTKTGRLVAFSFIANNLTGRYSKIDKIHKELLVQLAEKY